MFRCCGAVGRGVFRKFSGNCLSATGLGLTVFTTAIYLSADQARAVCSVTVGPNSVTCAPQTSTTDTINAIVSGGSSADRWQQFASPGDITVSIPTGSLLASWGVVGNGLAVTTSDGTAAINVTNDSVIRVDAGNSPSQGGGSAALEIFSGGGGVTYSGLGTIANNGDNFGNGLAVGVGSLGSGDIDITADGGIGSLGGIGIFARNDNTDGIGAINITTNAVISALDGMDVRTSANGNIDIKVNADIIGSASGFDSGISATINPFSTAGMSVALNNASIGSADNRAQGGGIDANIFEDAEGGDGASNGNIVVSLNNASIFASANVESGPAINAATDGAGDVSVIGTGTGTISAITADAIDVAAKLGGNIKVDVSQDLIGKSGVSAVGSGNMTVNAKGNVDATAGDGINVKNVNAALNSATIDVSLAAGKTLTAKESASPGSGNGIVVDTGLSTGQTTITVDGTIKADQTGIKGTSKTGNITTNVSSTGVVDPLIGIDQTTISGALTVNNAGLIEGDQIGVRLTSTGSGVVGDLTVNQTGTGKISVNLAGGQQGIFLDAIDANLIVTGNGNSTLVDASNGTHGIEASTFGNIHITDNEVIGGSGDGIKATSLGSGNIVVDGTGDLTALNGFGINATLSPDAGPAGGITINRTGNISGLGGVNAQIAFGSNAGNIDVTTNGTIVAGTDSGITAENHITGSAGTVTITNNSQILINSGTSGGAIGTNTGIYGRTAGNGAVTITSNADIGGAVLDDGIIADTCDCSPASVNVNLSNASIGSLAGPANFTGITAIARGTGSGNVNVDLNNASIFAGKDAVGTKTKQGSAPAIAAFNLGNGNININGTGSGTINSVTGTGVLASIVSGPGQVSIDMTQNVTGVGGIDANTIGTGTVSVTARGTVTGTNDFGIKAFSAGDVSVLATGLVTGANIGINAASTGTGNVIVSGTGAVVAAKGDGIVAQAKGGGDVTVAPTSAVTGGTGGNAIQAIAALGGKVTVTSNGIVTATDAGFGIDAQSAAGAIAITNNALASGVGAGVSGTSDTGAITINANGNATATQNAIQAYILAGGASNISVTQAAGTTAMGAAGIVTKNTGSGATTINSNGIVIGTSSAGIGVTTTLPGSAVTINNTGTVTGASDAISANVAGGAFTINNGGTLNGSVVVLSSDAGSSSFNNSGTWNNGSNNSGFNGNVSNSGMINMADGVSGNTTITVFGNYVGLGGNVKMDAFLGGTGSAADLFYVKGNSSGTTKLAVNDTNIGLGVYNPVGIPLVLVDGTSSASDFKLASGPINKGIFTYDLKYGGGEFFLVTSQNSATNTPLTLLSSVQGVWQTTTASTISHLIDMQDQLNSGSFITAVADPPLPEDPGKNVWLQPFGTWNHAGERSTASSYDQGIYGLVGGADFGVNSGANSHMLLGVSAAYVGSNINVHDGFGSTTDENGFALATQASFFQKGFFVNAVAEANFLNTKLNVAGSTASPNVRTYGGRADVGYRFGPRFGYFVEPMLSAAATHSDIDTFTIAGATYAGQGSDVKVGAGARIGIHASDLSLDVTTRLWEHLQSGNTFTVTPVGPSFTVTDPGLFPSVSAELSGKASYNLSSRTNVFIDGAAESDGTSFSLAAKSGMTFRW